MTQYAKATSRIDRLTTLAGACDEPARKVLADHVTALTTIRDGYTLEEAEKES